MAEELQCRRI